jgi:hypothetical protein
MPWWTQVVYFISFVVTMWIIVPIIHFKGKYWDVKEAFISPTLTNIIYRSVERRYYPYLLSGALDSRWKGLQCNKYYLSTKLYIQCYSL